MEDETNKPPEEPRRVGKNNNLTVPAKGEVRNPNGRGKGTLNRKTIFMRLLSAPAVENFRVLQAQELGEMLSEHQPETILDQIAAALLIKAIKGDQDAIESIFDNVCEKLTEKREISGSMSVAAALDSVSKRGPDKLPALRPPTMQEPECQTTPTKIPLPRLKPSKPQS